MNNFFYSSSDYDSFKKAFRATKNEPVIINVMSNDSSLTESGAKANSSERKNMSAKFQASPFDKFFGPRKKRTDPLDMKDFSSWKNKNYRESEKQIDEAPEETTKFSFSDYLKSRTKDEMFNDEDKIKSELQKPIEEMSSSDESYEKFSLDSYLTKLERETKAQKDFSESEDLIDFVDEETVTPTSEQDENFGFGNDVDVEKVAFDDGVGGEKFAFEGEELDKVKNRIEKMEREARNIKDKPTSKVLTGDELSEYTHSGDEKNEDFSLDKLGFDDDIERVNQKLEDIDKRLQVTGDGETSAPNVVHKKFVEINKNSDSISEDETNETLVEEGTEAKAEGAETGDGETEKSTDREEGVVEPEIIAGAVASDDAVDESSESFVDAVEMPEELPVDRTEGLNPNVARKVTKNKDKQVRVGFVSQQSGNAAADGTEVGGDISSDEVLTKSEFKQVTDELMSKVSEISKNQSSSEQQAAPVQEGFDQAYYGQGQYQTTYGQPEYIQTQAAQQARYAPVQPTAGQQEYVQTQTAEQREEQRRFQQQQAELETKIVELIEQNRKSDDDVAEKLQMVELEKQKLAEQYESRLRELESSIKKREEEAKQQAYIEKLKSDIKFKKAEASFKIKEEKIKQAEKMNLESQFAGEKLRAELKNTLQVSNLEMDKKLLECVTKRHKTLDADSEIVEETEEIQEVEKPRAKRAPARTTKRKTQGVKSRTRTRTPRRKMDSDIIGGIDFD